MGQITFLISLLIGAFLFGISFRANAISFAPWLGLAFLLHATRGISPSRGLPVTAFVLYIALAFVQRGILPVPDPLYFIMIAGITLVAVAPFVVDRLIATRNSGWITTLIFPLAWVTFDFAQTRLAPGGSWESIAYSQYGNLPLMQLAAFTGTWGITFLIAWFASILNWGWEQKFLWSTIRVPALTFVGVCSLVLIAGGIRIVRAHKDGQSVRAAAVSFPAGIFQPGERTRIAEGRIDATDRAVIEEKLSRLHQSFLERTRVESRGGAKLVAWPETNLLVLQEDEPSFLEHARKVAVEERIYLAMGLGTVHVGNAKPLENKIVMIDPAGQTIFSYEKSHPVPGWEESIMVTGDGRLPVVATDLGRVGSAICFDADFPEYLRQLGRARTDLMVLPVNDWAAIKYQHFAMTAFRAIENGIPILRAASSGVSGAFDAWGRVVALTDHFSGTEVMVAEIPIGSVTTLYSVIGDLFAWLCVAGLIAGSVVLMLA
jgi:apolipoprotein N-acyltransferase